MNETEDNYYEARMDKIFGKGSIWSHRTLRTIFDPFSSEWAKTNYERKIEILEILIASGESLELLVDEYKDRYKTQNRIDIASSVDEALAMLLTYKLTNRS